MAEADAFTIESPVADAKIDRAGQQLRAARDRAGLDRAELATRTKINERHLEAIEAGDFAALPARIYAVGFARTYAGAVGLDGATIAAQVREELAELDNPYAARPTHQLEIGDPAKVPSRRVAWLAGALGLALIAAGVVFWRSWFVPAVDLPPVTPTVEIASPAAAIAPIAEARLPVAEGAPAPGEAPLTSAAGSTPPPRRVVSTVARPDASRAAPAPALQQSLPSPVPETLEPATTEPAAPPPVGE